MSSFNTDWQEVIRQSRERRAARKIARHPLNPLPVTTPARPKQVPRAKRASPEQVTSLQNRLTWAYHAEATAKNDDERTAARVEREHINRLLMEASR